MSDRPDEQFSQANLDSPAYRRRLMRKLNCLIAVLEVATAKVRRSLEGPDADVERLERIKKNLTDTLAVCRKAKSALERREKLPPELPIQLQDVTNFRDVEEGGERPFELARRRRGSLVEMTSKEELERFAEMGPIGSDEIESVDFEALGRQLQS
ncbi:MAG: hypothetical protein R3F34_17085 [Planctomycetota bacterium]